MKKITVIVVALFIAIAIPESNSETTNYQNKIDINKIKYPLGKPTFDKLHFFRTTAGTHITTEEELAQSKLKRQNELIHMNCMNASDAKCKSYIIAHEGKYYGCTTNPNYYGAYQLSYCYMNGYPFTAEGEEQAAYAYMVSRYGTWQNAYEHKVKKGWW